MGLTKPGPSTYSRPFTVAVYPPLARDSAATLACRATSSGASAWVAGAVCESKMRGELTIAACCGAASGTLMTSIRKRALLGFESGLAATQPGSSLGERTGAAPEMYTYTSPGSLGSVTTECV